MLTYVSMFLYGKSSMISFPHSFSPRRTRDQRGSAEGRQKFSLLSLTQIENSNI